MHFQCWYTFCFKHFSTVTGTTSSWWMKGKKLCIPKNVKHLRQLFKHLMQATSSIWCSNNCSFQTENTIICIFLQTQNKVQTTMRNCWKDSHQVNCICDNKHHQILRLFDTFCTFSYISKLNSSTVMYQNFFTRRCSTTFITSYVGKMNVGQQTSPQS